VPRIKKPAHLSITEFSSQVLENWAAPVIITDSDGVISYINPAFALSLGYSRSEVIGKNSSLLLSDLNPPSLNQDIFNELIVGRVWKGNIITVKKSGEILNEPAIVVPIIEKDHALKHYITIFNNPVDFQHVKSSLDVMNQELNFLLHSIPDIIFRLNSDGIILDCKTGNPQDLFLPIDQIIGRSILEVLPTDASDSIRQGIKITMHGGEASVNYSLPLHDKEVSFQAKLRKLNGNEVVAVIRNTTDLIEKLDEVKQSENKIRAIIESMVEGIAVLDKDLNIITFNRLASESIQRFFDKTIAIGASFKQFILPEMKDLFMQNFHHALTGRKVQSKQTIYDLNEQESTIIFSYEPYQLAKDRIDGILLRVIDITSQITTEKALSGVKDRLSSFINSATDILILLDNDMRVIEANEIFFSLINIKREKLIGKRIGTFNTKTLKPELLKALISVLKTGEPIELDDYQVSLGGSVSFFRIKLFRTLEGIGIVATNTTKLHFAQQELIESQERYHLAVSETNDGIWDWNLLSNVVYFSPVWYKILGYDDQELPYTLQSWTDQVHPDDLPEALLLISEHLQGKTDIYRNSFRMAKRDGVYIWVEVKAKRVLSPEQKPIRLVGTVTNITDRIHTEESLRKAKAEAEEANHSKSEFLANMSHEIRTPMNGILGVLDLFDHHNLSPQQQEHLEIIESSAKSLLVLINDILDYSKIEAGKIDFEDISFNLWNLLDYSIHMQAMSAQNRKVNFYLHVFPDVPRFVSGDSSRLRQILMNLLNNAAKFTQDGYICLTVAVLHEERGKLNLRFLVEDTGIGIATDKRETIFDSFRQADQSVSRRYGGTGLGLAISRQLVRLMGGDIWVQSQLGLGSKFYFDLPLKSLSQPSNEISQYGFIRKKRVLAVASDSIQLQVINDVLRMFFSDIDTTSFKSLLPKMIDSSIIAERPYDLLIIDTSDPLESDIALLQSMLQQSSFPAQNVIALLPPIDSEEICSIDPRITCLKKPLRIEEFYRCLRLLFIPRMQEEEKKKQQEQALQDNLLGEKSYNILLVEDNLINQKIAKQMLAKLGHRVEVANNGLEAISKFHEESWDLILMDVQMPEMDGLTATRAIRALEMEGNLPKTPIIAMTAHAMKEDRDLCLRAGMDDYISKPVQIKEIKRKLSAHLF